MARPHGAWPSGEKSHDSQTKFYIYSITIICEYQEITVVL